MRLTLIFCFLFSYGLTYAQLKKIPQSSQMATARLSAVTTSQIQGTPLKAITLPFWDDFSFNNSSKGHVNDSLWQFGHSVWVNAGMGINPPTFNVASFDGLDSLGKPYTDVTLTKGFADKLESRSLRMDLVPVAKRDSVFISFFYQYQGNGEPPDPGDDLSLWFKKSDTTWIQVWSVGYDTLKDKTKFVKVKIRVKDTCSTCFYDNFRFRFQNFARLSGQFDIWNLDYVYVSNGENQNQYGSPDIKDFPDRAIATPPTSVLKQYHSVPAKHLLSKGDSLWNYMSFHGSNLRENQKGFGQVVGMDSWLTTVTRFNGVVTSSSPILFDNQAGTNFPYGDTTFVFKSIPHLTIVDPVDSIAMTFKIALRTGDNINKISGTQGADYDSIVYKGINFRVNDTIRTNFIFTNYYAYDDGEAESAVTLTNPGNYLAYEYNMMYLKPDTLTGIDIYFPHVGDESSQVLHLIVCGPQLPPLNVSRNTKPYVLTQQDIVVKRTENNLFTHIDLDTAVLVDTKFFIGYRQNVAADIGVGFDGDSDSHGKLLIYLGGTKWDTANVHGNLMMRPVFGKKKKSAGTVTAIEEKKITFYPNPNHGTFYLTPTVQSLQIVDITGRAITFDREDSYESTQVTLRNTTPGIYLARYYNGTQWRTEKIMVLP